MSDSQIKPIKINPELFSLSRRSVKNKTLKKSTINNNIKPNKLKQDLLIKIKNFRQNKHLSDKATSNNNNSIQNVIKNETLPYTSKIEVKKSISNLSNKISQDLGENNDDFTQSINFLKDLSVKNNKKKQPNNDFPLSSTDENRPPYSSMKNSSLPTYREWKNKTLKNNNNDYEDTIHIDPIIEKHNSNDLKKINSQNITINENISNKNDIDLKKINSQNITINENISNKNDIDLKENISKYSKNKSTTLKYYLGKRGRKVGVLVKNIATRKNIINEHNLLKQTKLSDMKNYLKRHNLLKSGSHAPPEIIKKMYEQSLLGGDIRNSNKANVIHNYLAK